MKRLEKEPLTALIDSAIEVFLADWKHEYSDACDPDVVIRDVRLTHDGNWVSIAYTVDTVHQDSTWIHIPIHWETLPDRIYETMWKECVKW